MLVDPSLARGLSYYTGAIMEIAVPDLAGSLGGGGRYDGLIGMFSGEDLPACGFSLGLERILVVMTERGMFPGRSCSAAAGRDGDAVRRGTEGDEALRLARELRAASWRPGWTCIPRPTSRQAVQGREQPRLGPESVVGGDERAGHGDVEGHDHAASRASSRARMWQ